MITKNKKYSKIVLFCPTNRPQNDLNIFGHSDCDFELLNKFLEENNILLLRKIHSEQENKQEIYLKHFTFRNPFALLNTIRKKIKYGTIKFVKNSLQNGIKNEIKTCIANIKQRFKILLTYSRFQCFLRVFIRKTYLTMLIY